MVRWKKRISFFERQKGFTIVELLVVIVVIAILAAIAIVSYNGVTEQARSSQRLVALDAWEKSIRVYETMHGQYPIPAGQTSYGACLGSDFSPKGDFEQGECVLVNGANAHRYYENTEINDMLAEYMNIPDADFPYARMTVPGYDLQQRGFIYYVSTSPSEQNGTVYLAYYTTSNAKCGRGVMQPIGERVSLCKVTLRESL